jgi:hypothetical protein
MTSIVTINSQTWIRLLQEETTENERSFDVGSWGIRLFEWIVAFNILMVLLCIVLERKSAQSNGIDTSIYPNVENITAADRKISQEKEEEGKKNIITKLFQSEHIQQVRIEYTNRLCLNSPFAIYDTRL